MADRDYYEVLGVARDATPEQLKKAYRGLARKHHPDVNPGSKDAERLFKEAQSAYDILNDPEKRSLYDRFGHAAFQGGSPAGPRSSGAEWAARSGGGHGGPSGFENIDLGDFFRAGQEAEQSGGGGGGGIFDDLLGRMRSGRAGPRRAGPRPGRDINASLSIPFATAVLGGETTIELEREPGQRETLVVKVPVGTEPGARLRLRGQGEAGEKGAPAGSLTITVGVEAHPYFTRDGRNLLLDLPITLGEAVLGARVDVPTLHDGTKTLTIPPGASSGQKLRLRGQGVPASGGLPAGDLLIALKVVVPKSIDDESRTLIQQFADRNPSNPRAGLW